jgi:hypothetical protein
VAMVDIEWCTISRSATPEPPPTSSERALTRRSEVGLAR